MNPELRFWLLLGGALAGYGVLMWANPIRSSLRDGFRCLRRYTPLWTTLAAFGFCYAAFQLLLRLLEMQMLPEGDRPILQWSRAWFFPHVAQTEVAKESLLQAFEGVAGIFNNAITTFPFSAVAAFLLLINWQGHHLVLNRTLRRHFGQRGWLIYGAITLCAVAAVVKPTLYIGLPILGQYLPGRGLVQISSIIDWLSFLFEYLFGVCIQIYLILLVYVWVRGVNFTHEHLLDFAIRRFTSVMKWAVLVLLLSTALIHLPLILSNIAPFSFFLTPPDVDYYLDHCARPLLAVFLICSATFQITLVFHSESLRQAARDHMQFVQKNFGALLWFLLIAWIHFYGFRFLDGALIQGLGSGTALGILWQLSAPLIGAFIAGWLLASWVCVFKRSDTHHSQKENWVAF